MFVCCLPRQRTLRMRLGRLSKDRNISGLVFDMSQQGVGSVRESSACGERGSKVGRFDRFSWTK